jgi:hypothetical protein
MLYLPGDSLEYIPLHLCLNGSLYVRRSTRVFFWFCGVRLSSQLVQSRTGTHQLKIRRFQ